MSSSPGSIRNAGRRGVALAALLWLGWSGTALAQAVEPGPDPAPRDAPGGTPPQRIDILADREAAYAAAERDAADCSRDDRANPLSSEIVVCRRLGDGSDGVWDKEAWENRYAAETAYRGDPKPVDVCGPNCGIFKGEPTVGSLCIPGLQKCPPPPAYIIDFASLPDAPPGSDADRIARGLPPLGREGAAPTPAAAQPATPARAEALGLPPTPEFAGAEPVSPAESAAPAAPR